MTFQYKPMFHASLCAIGHENLWQPLTMGAYMGAALSHDKTVDAGAATRARLAGAAKYVEFVGIATLVANYRVKISLTATQAGS